MIIETPNNRYEVINFKRKDGLFNTYVEKKSKLSNTFKGKAVFSIGNKEKNTLIVNDVLGLTYNNLK